jgi:hypothetical protein
MQKVTLSKSTLEQLALRDCPEQDKKYLEDALYIVRWAASFGEPILEGSRYKRFSPGALNRASHFNKMPRKALDELLKDLEAMNVLSEAVLQKSTGGRPSTLVTLDASFVETTGRTAEDIEGALVARFIAKFRRDQPYVIADPEIQRRMTAEHAKQEYTIDPGFLTETAYEETRFCRRYGASTPSEPSGFRGDRRIVEPVIKNEYQTDQMASPVKALYDFHASVDGRLLSFKKGRMITDPFIARILIDQKMPVIGADEKVVYQHCPTCHTRKDLSDKTCRLNADGIYLKPIVDFMVVRNGDLLRVLSNQVLTDQYVNKWILTQPECCPVVRVKENIDFLYCSNQNCRNPVFFIDPLIAQGLV